MSYITVQPAGRAGLELMLDWAAAEGWNPGRDDGAPFLAADPDGFLIAFEGDAPRSCISVTRHGAGFGFLGFFITHPEHRGQGFGRAVWQAGMAHLAGRNIGLDGVVGEQAGYRRKGFTLAHRNQRHGGVIAVAGPRDPRIVACGAIAPELLERYDRRHFPDDRSTFLRAWTRPPRVALALVEDGAVMGYGVLRACREGGKIGPLFAETPRVAEALLLALASEAPGQKLYLDIPLPNAEAVRLAAAHGLVPVFDTARMYTGGDPGLPLERIYGITTLELG